MRIILSAAGNRPQVTAHRSIGLAAFHARTCRPPQGTHADCGNAVAGGQDAWFARRCVAGVLRQPAESDTQTVQPHEFLGRDALQVSEPVLPSLGLRGAGFGIVSQEPL
jgi:hypothetical protein